MPRSSGHSELLKAPQKLLDQLGAFAWNVPKVWKAFSHLQHSPLSKSSLTQSYSLFETRNVPSSRKSSPTQHVPVGLAPPSMLPGRASLTCSTCPLCCVICTGLSPWTVGSVRARAWLASFLYLGVYHTAGKYCTLMECASCYSQRFTGNAELMVQGHLLANFVLKCLD